MMELMGQRAKVESGGRWLKAETVDPQKMDLGTGRPKADPHHQMGHTEDEPRERQKPAGSQLVNWLASVEEVGREAGRELWKHKRLEAGWDKGKQEIQWYILLKIINIISRGQARALLPTQAPGQMRQWAQAPGWNLTQLGSLACYSQQAQAPCL